MNFRRFVSELKISRRFIIILVAIILLTPIPIISLAASDIQNQAATQLFTLGLFNGVGNDDQGRPIFSLDRAPTRAEGVTLLVRFLGKDAAALSEPTDNLPFTDVPEWAAPYVAYAYRTGLSNGVSADRFGADSTMTATQYLTFILRALGYRDGTDFQWNTAWTLTDSLRITNYQFDSTHTAFTRGDSVQVSVNALSKTVQDNSVPGRTLLKLLTDQGAVTETQVIRAGLEDSLYLGGVKPTPTPTPTPSPTPVPEYYSEISVEFDEFSERITLQNAYAYYEYDSSYREYTVYIGSGGTITFDEDVEWDGYLYEAGKTYRISDANGLEITARSGNKTYTLVFIRVSSNNTDYADEPLEDVAITNGPRVANSTSTPKPIYYEELEYILDSLDPVDDDVIEVGAYTRAYYIKADQQVSGIEISLENLGYEADYRYQYGLIEDAGGKLNYQPAYTYSLLRDNYPPDGTGFYILLVYYPYPY